MTYKVFNAPHPFRWVYVTLMLFVFINAFCQPNNSVKKSGQTSAYPTQVTISQKDAQLHVEAFLHLQTENEELRSQLEKMEKEIDVYREDVRTKSSEIDSKMNHWLQILSIIIGVLGIGLGIVTPLLINNKNEKRLERKITNIEDDLDKKLLHAGEQVNEAAQQAAEAGKQASKASKQAELSEKTLAEIIEQVKNAKDNADRANVLAHDSRIFSEEARNISQITKSQVSDIEDQVKQAKEAIKQIEELKNHIAEMEKSINTNKVEAEKAANEAKAYGLFAQAVHSKESVAQIEDVYNQITEIAPDFYEAYNNRALIKVKNKDFDGALSDYNKAISLRNDDASLYSNRGNLKIDMKDFEGAMTDFNQAISINPNFAQAYYNRANLKNSTKDYRGAISDLDHAIEINKRYTDAYINRGFAKVKTEDYSGALKDYNAALEITHNDVMARENRIVCLSNLLKNEQDETKKAEIREKIKVDEKKIESLKNEQEK